MVILNTGLFNQQIHMIIPYLLVFVERLHYLRNVRFFVKWGNFKVFVFAANNFSLTLTLTFKKAVVKCL